MLVAICGNFTSELDQLRRWVMQFYDLYGEKVHVVMFTSPDRFAEASQPGVFHVAVMGFSGSTGFLAARTLRERDKNCRIILIDDTAEYSIRGVRLHFADFIMRPVEFGHIVRSMKLAMGGGRL